ncbi:MAG: hypothetical protein HQL32_04815 [Planctomycetes bacterium]|nr:hypothetical protein [Planctomycetota bacterium]
MEKKEKKQKEVYKKIGDMVRSKSALSDLDVRTIFNHLIRLPEVYKLDFINVHLATLLQKSPKNRDELLLEHYHNYISVPSLSALISVLRNSKLEFGESIVCLIEHIRNLQLMPGPSTKEREMMETLQFDIIYMLQQSQSGDQLLATVDLSEESKRVELAECYYERILSSFISENDDDLVSESEFIEGVKNDILKSKLVKDFALQSTQKLGGDKKEYLRELGGVISSTIQTTYLENYQGIFNGNRDFVLKQFKKVIDNRCHDSENPNCVELQPITSGILAESLELIFNSGFGAFRDTLTLSILNQFK